jgi:hypothetical protein
LGQNQEESPDFCRLSLAQGAQGGCSAMKTLGHVGRASFARQIDSDLRPMFYVAI